MPRPLAFVIAAEQIAFEDFEAGAIARDKARSQRFSTSSVCASASISATSVPTLIGSHRAPAASGMSSRKRRDAVEHGAALRGALHRVALDVPADAAAGDLGVLQRHAAEGQHVSLCSAT
jgi:hypothetical protein